MPHSFTKLTVHCIFAVKGRQAMIDAELRERLYGYIGGIVRESGGCLSAIGGTTDHVHLLIDLPAPMSVAEMMRVVKANSSKWIRETFPDQASFAWQTGYGAFAVSLSAVEEVREYIRHQEEHHRKRTFEEEFLDFIQRHGLKYDARYLWDD